MFWAKHSSHKLHMKQAELNSPMGPKTYKKRNLLRVHTHTHTLLAVNLADSLTSWHEFMNNHAWYPGCFLVTRKQDDITVVCAWATNLDMSSGNTTKCHVLFLYFGVFHVAILKNKLLFVFFVFFSCEKLSLKHTKTTNHWFLCVFLFPHVFFTVKNDKKLPSLHERCAELSRSWQMSQKLR